MENNRAYNFIKNTELIEGNQYWVCMAILNNKYTGLVYNLKPTLATLTKGEKGYPHYEKLFFKTTNKPFEKSAYGYQNFKTFGYISKNEQEIVNIYDNLLDECAKECKNNISNKYSNSYINDTVANILKHKSQK